MCVWKEEGGKESRGQDSFFLGSSLSLSISNFVKKKALRLVVTFAEQTSVGYFQSVFIAFLCVGQLMLPFLLEILHGICFY